MSLLSPDLILVLMAALTAAGLVGVVTVALTPQKPMVKRAREMLDPAAQRRNTRSRAAGGESEPRTAAAMFKRLARRFGGLRAHAGEEVAVELTRAGWRSKDAVVLFICARIATPFVCGGVALLLFNVLEVVSLGPSMERLAPVAGTLLGFFIPKHIVKRAINEREKAIGRALPNALDLLVICAEAGLSLDFALQRVAGELEASDPAMADELALTALERRLLPERRKALTNLANRCQLPSVRALTQTLLQAEEYGTPLSQSLRVLASEMRSERMLKAEAKAAKTPVMMTVPLVVFIMPALFIVLIGPGILKTIDSLSNM